MINSIDFKFSIRPTFMCRILDVLRPKFYCLLLLMAEGRMKAVFLQIWTFMRSIISDLAKLVSARVITMQHNAVLTLLKFRKKSDPATT